ncbi:hypothetical protein LTR36_009537 [Oleoguttula mirabilis]|uniref:Kri1-like C-terminal domain-containing protein n=1 Tax=Oleoguttula mirabilis TaxID=1507867 RepID=A0AAV9JSZ8_9PEZI|nr:hypothetical protein LTR36_009537 [Oleoguttula mirabilis]
MPRPAKRAKLLDDASSASESEDNGRNGVRLPDVDPNAANGFTINAEFAKRFEHNKKREERSRLEEKLAGANGKRGRNDEDDESSSDESEDDHAELADESLDAEIQDVLQAIRSKDPRVRDPNAKFYRDFEADAAATVDGGAAKKGKEKPMYLHDYHRQNMLAGHTGEEEEDDAPVQTYQQEQDALKRELVGSMHATTAGEAAEDDESDVEEDFLVAKSKPKHDTLPTAPKSKPITNQDVAAADKDPESYLSNFMAARAWLPKDNSSRFQAFDSDDSDDDRRADEFEEAYNMRFEDPKKANEKLQSFARDVGKYGVRRDEKSGRAKAREREREQKEAGKREREEDKARLRKLKIEEAEEKVNRIREAAGLRGKDVDLKQWRDIIEGDFDDDQWDLEMQRRFGAKYYAEHEGAAEDSDEEMADADGKKKSSKVKKPKWEDDIDIKDLLPDFVDDEEAKPDITLSDEDDEDADGGAPLPAAAEDVDEDGEEGEDEAQAMTKRGKTKKDRLQEKADVKRAARKQRMAIEEIVDASLPLHHAALPTTTTTTAAAAKPPAGFRYRETSPTSFGMSARDILFADDAKLNEFVGLKKMAAWRDDEKKRRDRKKFSKKARLRQWRKETFGGKGEEPVGGFERVVGGGEGGGYAGGYEGAEVGGGLAGGEGEGGVKEGERKKKRRSKKRKGEDGGAAEAV